MTLNRNVWENQKWIFVLLITIFGSTIYLPEGSDGHTLQQMVFDHYQNISIQRWSYELEEMLVLSPEPGTKGDVFSHVLSYIVGNVIPVSGAYFIIVSWVYAFFYIRALSRIIDFTEVKEFSMFLVVFISIFIVYRFIDSMQSVRTWTGAWVLFNGVYDYYSGNRKGLIFILMAPLFHVAYFLIILPVIIGLLGKRLPSVVFIIIYATSFFVSINQYQIIDQLKRTDLGTEKVDGYYREEIENNIATPVSATNANWYKEYGKFQSHHWGGNILAMAIIIGGLYKRTKMTAIEWGLFTVGLLLATSANLGDFILPFYRRTMSNAGMYFTAVSCLLLLRGQLINQGTNFISRTLVYLSPLVFVPYFVFTIANMIQYTSVFMVGAPFLVWIFPEENLSIRELIGSIL